MPKKYADIRIELSVSFDDNGDDDLKDQAIEAAIDEFGISPQDFEFFEVIGEVRDTELPKQDWETPDAK